MTKADSRVGTRFGRYELVSLLGRGGMGEVYEAHDSEKNRRVAVKILRAEYAEDDRFRSRFLRESHAAAILQEPHVIPIHDWGEIDGSLFIDMRLVEGRTLHDLVQLGPLEPERAVKLIEQTAAALDAAHAAGLIHRDVKPQNIIVTAADFAYLVDFGIVEIQGDTRLTMDGSQIGSLAYMPPERFGDLPTTPAADIYSLTCVLYEALTGNTPFQADSFERLITSHLMAPPPRAAVTNDHVPDSLDDVIAQGMAKDPGDRYKTASAMARAARSALNPGVMAASAETRVGPAPLSGQRVATRESVDIDNGPTDENKLQSTVLGSRRRIIPIAVGIAVALLLGVVGVVVGVLMARPSGNTASVNQVPTPTLAPAPRPSYTVPATNTARPTITVTASASPPPIFTTSDPPRSPTILGVVVGTCDEGGSCGVKQRTGPYTDAPRLYQNDLRDGATVTVICQAIGDLRTSRGAGSSAVWFRLGNGAYVNTVYMNLSSYGVPSC